MSDRLETHQWVANALLALYEELENGPQATLKWMSEIQIGEARAYMKALSESRLPPTMAYIYTSWFGGLPLFFRSRGREDLEKFAEDMLTSFNMTSNNTVRI